MILTITTVLRDKAREKKERKTMNRRMKELFISILRRIPSNIGNILRSNYYRKFVGNYSLIRYGVIISHPENLRLGKGVSIGYDTIIRAKNGVEIGDYTMVSWRVNILSLNHNHCLNGVPFRFQGSSGEKVVIGKNCWIGCNVSILSGAKIGNNCVIGAASVITKDIPDNSVVVGVNKIIKTIPTQYSQTPPELTQFNPPPQITQ